jgi:hypothetical protein
MDNFVVKIEQLLGFSQRLKARIYPQPNQRQPIYMAVWPAAGA